MSGSIKLKAIASGELLARSSNLQGSSQPACDIGSKRTALLSELAHRLSCLRVAGIPIDGCGPLKWMGDGEKSVRFEL